MNLQFLIDYQEVDKKLFSLEMQVKNSEAAKKIHSLSVMKKDLGDEIVKASREIYDAVGLIEKNNKIYESISFQISELAEVLSSFEEPREIDLYEKKLAQQLKELESIEKEIVRISKQLNILNDSSKEAISKIMQCNQALKTHSASVEKLKSELIGEVKEIKMQLNDLAKNIDEDLLKKYNNIRKTNKMPVAIQVKDDCCYCGISIDGNDKFKLTKQDYIECHNCGRIIYK